MISIFLVLSFLLATKNLSVVIAALTSIISIAYLVIYRKDFSWDNTDKLVVACLSAYLISNIPLTIIDTGNFRYFRGASRLLLCIPIYFFFKYHLRINEVYFKPMVWGVIVGSLGALSIACYQFFIEGRPRVDGFLFSINFGYLACSLSILSVALLVYNYHRALLLISLVASSTALLMTLTRGAIIALPITIIFTCILGFKKNGITRVIIAGFIITALSIALYSKVDVIKKRVDFTIYEAYSILNGDINEAPSSGYRLLLWRAAYEAFKEDPLIGLTHPEREELNKNLAEKGIINDWAAGIQRGHAHSQYFDQLASGGILGLISILFTLFIPLLYFAKQREISKAAYVGCLFVFSFALFCLTEVALQQNLISTFYGYMLALFFAATQLEVKDNMARAEAT